MASPSQQSVDLPILTFGGRVTQYDPQGLPMGATPAEANNAFSGLDPSGKPIVTGVATRPGMRPFYTTPFAANPTVNYLRTFVDAQAIYHLLSLDGLGNMRDESPCPEPPGVPTLIGTVVAASIAQSDSLINREWIAVSSPLSPGFGSDIPRQWNGRFWDRVSQCGPGAGPVVADSTDTLAIATAPVGVTQEKQVGVVIYEVGNTVFIVCTPFPGAQAGDIIVIPTSTPSAYEGTWALTEILPNGYAFQHPTSGIAQGTATIESAMVQVNLTAPTPPELFDGINVTLQGVPIAGYNGLFVVRFTFAYDLVPPNPLATSFTINVGSANIPLAPSGGGTILAPGSVSLGRHGVAVSFITRENYITRPSVPVYWDAGGSLKATLTKIPTGPSNIIGRVIMFTPVITSPATSGPFFYFDGAVQVGTIITFPTMVIMDNTTTTAEFDFLDAVLENATASTNLFGLVELEESSSVCAYSDRVFWCGGLNFNQQMLNMEFNGGWNLGGGIGGSDVPLGWTSVHGGTARVADGGVWLDALSLTGIAGINLSQQVFQDYLGVPILQQNALFSARVPINASVNDTLELAISSVSTGFFTSANVVSPGPPPGAAQFQTVLVNFPLAMPSVLPADLLLTVTAFTPTGPILIDRIEIFPTLTPYNSTQVRGSYALDPESFDETTGIMDVGTDNGYPMRAMFTLLDNKLYLVKELGLFSTQDDGQNEPDLWTINTVSNTMGTPSCRGVGVGESWAVIAHKTGAYIFWGSEPVKITQEIQPDWDMINWACAGTIYVVVDTVNKRIHIGAPVNGATTPNVEFVCDYSQLANAEGSVSGQDIASHPQAYYSVYNPTKVVAPGKARKWSIWDLTMNCASLTIRSDGQYYLLRGNGTGTGKVYKQDYTATSDDGVAIDSYYQTAYTPQIEDEQALQLGSHRKLFKYLTGYVSGSGTMSWYMYGANNQRGVQLSNLTLQSPPLWDFEKNTNWIGERTSYLFGINAVGSWYHLTKLCPTLQRELITPIRGTA